MKSNKQARREARQLFQSCLVNGLMDENLARQAPSVLLAATHRKGAAILAHFLRLVRLDRDRHTANIESATSLARDLRAAIEAGLKTRYGPGLTTMFSERTALIGGVRIQVGCDVYDNTVLAGLKELEKSF